MTTLLSRRLSALALAMVIAVPASAQVAGSVDNTAYGGSSGEFLLLGAGARGAALGGAFAALSTDISALYYNPAGLAQLSRPGAMFSTYSYVADTRYSWVGMAFPLSGGVRAVGISLGTFGFNDQPVYTVTDPDGDGRTYSVNETAVGFTYAQNFSDRFSAGFTAKYVRDGLGETAATGFALDFGTSFHAMIGARPIRAAFILQNLGSSLQHSGDGLNVPGGTQREPPLGTPSIPQEGQSARLRSSSWTLPVLFRVSAALDLWSQGINRVTVLSEFTQPSNTKPGAGLGLEWMSTNLGNSGFSVAARGSYTINPDNNIDDISLGTLSSSIKSSSFTADGLAVGGGLGFTRGSVSVGVDYAYRDMGPLGGTNFLSFSLGW